MEEYKKIYSVSFSDELKARGVTDQDQKELEAILQQQLARTSYHFGDPHLNIATLAGLYRMTLKEFDRMHGYVTRREIKACVDIRDYL